MVKMNITEVESIKLTHNILTFITKSKKKQKIGLMYNDYIKEHGMYCFSYRTFQRVIDELTDRELIYCKIIKGGSSGKSGSTRIIGSKKNNKN